MLNENDQNKKSLIQKYNLLIDICDKPSVYREQDGLLASLKSQGGLAALVLPDTDMRPSALNTLKAHADIHIEGGFGTLNRLRINAKEALLGSLSKANAPKSSSQKRHKDKISDLNAQLDAERKSNLLLMMTVNNLRAELKKMAYGSKKDILIEKYLEVNKKIEAQLSYNNEVNPKDDC
ncbi:TPA: hypothetical protein RG682_001867 [Vibrio alginolyticus]|uniref:hypothetical protein n=1 Tax=Vibrio harveyi TaxID=669 RepID=UPI00280EC535|nr:conserved hypothetical protein [Vibrio harveyi]HDU8586395.1 hypothetical protein [Vibrio alginolyticus]